jgi:ABC-type transporter Mla subunit MlaD
MGWRMQREIPMPRKQYSELTAGIFVLFTLAVVVGVILWLGAGSLFDKSAAKVVFYSDNDAGQLGLLKDSKVFIGDTQVGKIVAIRIDMKKNRTLYDVSLSSQDVAVYTDCVAKVKAGLLGGSSLVLTELGNKTSGLTSETSPAVIRLGGFDEIVDNMQRLSESMVAELDAKKKGTLLSQIKLVVAELLVAAKGAAMITKQITPEMDFAKKDSTAASLKQTIAELKIASANVSSIIATVKPEFDFKAKGTMASDAKETFAHAKTASATLSKTMTRIDGYAEKDVAEILVKIREISTSVLKTANNLDVSSEEIKDLLVANTGSIDELIENMTTLSANLAATGKEVRRNPWRLLYQPTGKETKEANLYDAASSFSEGASRLNVVVTKLQALRKLDSKDPAAVKKVQEVREHLRAAFDEFQKVEKALYKSVGTLNKK